MRVIAGTAKGHQLRAPKGPDTRPTGDRVKEALFSSLQPDLPGSRVLDLFAGSGALGIEALSRGAAEATFVESDRRARAAIDANLTATHLADRATVFGRDVRSTLRALAGRGATFDLVLVDPPYAMAGTELGTVLDGIAEVTQAGALVRLEQASRRAMSVTLPATFVQTGMRRYGDTVIIEAVRAQDPGLDRDAGSDQDEGSDQDA